MSTTRMAAIAAEDAAGTKMANDIQLGSLHMTNAIVGSLYSVSVLGTLVLPFCIILFSQNKVSISKRRLNLTHSARTQFPDMRDMIE